MRVQRIVLVVTSTLVAAAGLQAPADGQEGSSRGSSPGSRAVETARNHLRENSAVASDRLDLVRATRLPGTPDAYVVLFRQRFPRVAGGRTTWLRAGAGGLVTAAVRGERVVHTTSSAFGDAASRVTAPVKLTPQRAWRVAAAREGRHALGLPIRSRTAKTARPSDPAHWTAFNVPGYAGRQRARLVAVPGPRGEVRPAFETNVVDVEDGNTLAVTSFVDAETGRVLVRHNRVRHLDGGRASTASPPSTVWTGGCPAVVPGCGFRLDYLDAGPVMGALYDVDARPRTDLSNDDGWTRANCDVKRFGAQSKAVEAAVSTTDDLDVRLHGWAYGFGFTPATHNLQDADRVLGEVHVGALKGGYPTYSGRNNAYQITLQDGLSALSGISLYQPVAGRWHGPCVDGALDPTVIAHEYAHGIVERMVAGPDLGVTSREGEAVSESWADLLAVQFMTDIGRPTRVIGAHVGGDAGRGIRSYALDANPLGLADYGRDPLLDNEIWSAVGSDLRQAIGGRSFTQLLFDSFLLQQSDVTMTGARDALLAADRLRTGGVNARTMWRVFAQRGLGEGAAPGRPSYSSPLEDTGRLVVAGPDDLRVSVGRSPAGAEPRRLAFVPGRYDLSWSAPGHGFGRTTVSIEPGATTRVEIDPARNLATGGTPLTDGRTETTATTRAGSFVVDLAGTAPRRVGRITLAGPGRSGAKAMDAVRRFAVDACTTTARSAALKGLEEYKGLDGLQGLARLPRVPKLPELSEQDCRRVFTSDDSAFGASRPYPRASDLEPRTFDLPGRPKATQLRLVVLETQCTGNPAYRGEQESDPLSPSDCETSRRGETASLGEVVVNR